MLPFLSVNTTQCPFCNHTLDIDMFNGMYGCDSGCAYVTFEVDCPNCNKMVYQTGEFGEYENNQEKTELREQFMTEFAAAVTEIVAERSKEKTT